MTAKALGEVRATVWAEVRAVAEKIRPQLLPPEALVALGALRRRMVRAVPEEKDTLFTAEIAGSLAVQVHDASVADGDRVVWPEQLEASRALLLSHEDISGGRAFGRSRCQKALTPVRQPRKPDGRRQG